MRRASAGSATRWRHYNDGGVAGLRPDEGPAILHQGERVLSRRDTAAYDRDRGSGGVNVTIVARDAESVRQSRTQIAADIARAVSLGALRTLGRLGIDVPRTVSAVGIDDLPAVPQAAFAAPRLTTVQKPMLEIGAAALHLLRDEMSGRVTPARRVELACRRVVRQSTAPRA